MVNRNLYLAAVLLLLTHVCPAQSLDDDKLSSFYQWGQGFSFPDLGLQIGGYGVLRGRDLAGQGWQADIGDLSLFLNWAPSTRWTVFSELEVEQAVAAEGDGVTADFANFGLERLYVDYAARRQLNLRFGKFLTPVGRWNLIHADPLVWTTSRPLTTEALFPRETAGAMAHGTFLLGTNELDYDLYADTGVHPDPREHSTPLESDDTDVLPSTMFHNGGGLRLRYHIRDDVQLGFSYLNFLPVGFESRKNLFGLDGLWISHGIETSGEAVYRFGGGNHEGDTWGAYGQTAVPLVGSLYGVTRYELFSPASSPSPAQIYTMGLAYRPKPGLLLKFEYRLTRQATQIAPQGPLASIALLF